MLKRLILVLIILSPLVVSAQYKGTKKVVKNTFLKRKVKKQKEWIVGVGAANFLGELGGANQIGTNFVRDLEFTATRPSAQIAYRYRFRRRWAVKTGIYWNLVSGNDNLTEEPARQNRNLHFKSNIWELSGQAEYYFTKEQIGRRYKIKNSKGMKSFQIQGYLFLGFGGFWFNPKARYDDKWVALQPLGTEGQGLPGARNKYLRASFCVPYGIGFKNALSHEWTIGLEIGMRKTFTDYIDDVSGVYYDNNIILAERGKMAADLADPSLFDLPGGDVDQVIYGTNKQSGAGQQRGDIKDLDSYMFINLTGTYIIPYRTKTRSKF